VQHATMPWGFLAAGGTNWNARSSSFSRRTRARRLVYGAGVANTAPSNIYGHLLSASEFYWPLYIAFVIVCDF
jgi:hypothetical protein